MNRPAARSSRPPPQPGTSEISELPGPVQLDRTQPAHQPGLPSPPPSPSPASAVPARRGPLRWRRSGPSCPYAAVPDSWGGPPPLPQPRTGVDSGPVAPHTSRRPPPGQQLPPRRLAASPAAPCSPPDRPPAQGADLVGGPAIPYQLVDPPPVEGAGTGAAGDLLADVRIAQVARGGLAGRGPFAVADVPARRARPGGGRGGKYGLGHVLGLLGMVAHQAPPGAPGSDGRPTQHWRP
jgi:hypothetical protein